MNRILKWLAAGLGIAAAAAAFFLIPVPSSAAPAPALGQGTLQYCEARAALALAIAESLAEGMPSDKINITFSIQPQNEEVAAAREAWIEDLKAEVDAAAATVPRDKDQWPARVAQKIIEACWQEYGRRGKAI